MLQRVHAAVPADPRTCPRTHRRGTRVAIRALAAVTLAASLAVPTAAVATPSSKPSPSHPTSTSHPSAADVAAGKAAVRRKAAALAATKAKLAAARSRMQALGVQVETAVEAYDGAEVRLQQATAQLAAANTRVDAAVQKVDEARARLDEMAGNAYETGNRTAQYAALLGGADPSMFSDAAQALRSVSAYQASALANFAVAKHGEVVARASTQARREKVQQAVAAAADARRAALVAAAQQQRTVADISALEAQDPARASVPAKGDHATRGGTPPVATVGSSQDDPRVTWAACPSPTRTSTSSPGGSSRPKCWR